MNILPLAATGGVNLTKSQTKVFAWGGFPIPVVGEIRADVVYKNKQTKATFHVIDSKKYKVRARALMNFTLCKELGLIKEIASSHNGEPSNLSNVFTGDPSAQNVKSERDESSLRDEFSDLFQGVGQLKTGDKYIISLKDDAKPYSPPARRLPPALIPKVKAELDRMVADEIIRPIDEPTKFCSPMVIAYRKSGDVRIVTDFRKLNKSINREELQIPTLDELAFKVKGAKYFSKCDLRPGFWQIPVDKDSEQYLAFSTPVGRYCYRKLPMGLSASPEFFSKVLNRVLEGLNSVLVYVDDIVICSRTVEEHYDLLTSVLQRLRDAGLRLNPEKCEFFRKEIEFMGHAKGLQNSPSKLAAIKQMSPPSDKISLRSFLGLAAYLGQRYIAHYSTFVKPLWDMLQEERFEWSDENTQTFYNVRDLLCKDTVLSYFDPSKDIIVQTDASKQGLGAVILQDNKPVVFVSRTLTDTETRYSQIELEFLAIVFGLTRLRRYLLGTKFVLMTDHKPIVQLMEKPIDTLSNRLQRWLVAIQHYSFKISHIKGSSNILADALSRNAIAGLPAESEMAEYTLCFMLKSAPIDLKAVAEATKIDPILAKVVHAINRNWKSNELNLLKPFYSMCEELTVKYTREFPILCKGSRVIVPEALRTSFLDTVHETHSGMNKMKAVLRGYCYWPGMNRRVRSSLCSLYSVPKAGRPLTNDACSRKGIYSLEVHCCRSNWTIRSSRRSSITHDY